MPTIRGESHEQRRVAESFGLDAERYDRTRPSYPEALIRRIVAESPGPEFLDVGIGTGIAARQFQAAGAVVLGVEPDPRMAACAAAQGTPVEVATFEAWHPAGRSFDAVVAAQSWHWVDPVAGAAKAAAVLRPGGRLAAFWNVGQLPEPARAAFAAVYEAEAPETIVARGYRAAVSALRGYEGQFAKAEQGIRETGRFGEPQRWTFEWRHEYPRDAWLDQVPTQGDHSGLAPGRLAAVLAGLGAAIDALGGRLLMDYTAVVVTAAREDDAGRQPTRASSQSVTSSTS